LPRESQPALMLCAEAPYPLQGGGAIRTASLLHFLAGRGEVDLIVFRQPGAPDPADGIPHGLVRQVSVIDLPRHGRSLPARAVRNVWRLARATPPLVDRFAGFGEQVRRAIGERRYRVGIVEHSWCAPYLKQVAAACQRTALDLHNIESELHASSAQAETGAQAFAHGAFSRASRKFERFWLPRYSEVLACSEQDAEKVRAIAPGANVRVYPNAIPFAPPAATEREDVIAFSGNLEYHPNILAVRRFRAEIWPEIRRRAPEVVWRLIGRGGEAVAGALAGDPRIELLGPVTDAVGELARAKVAVVPLLTGSGTRFKILEAWAAATPVVSTSIGAEGLAAAHGEHLLIADSPPDFAEAVLWLLHHPDEAERIALAGRCLMQKEYSWNAAWRRLDL
jgi:polysaccharide biosynthesis protein PslH